MSQYSLDLEDLNQWRYEFDSTRYRHTLRMYVDGKRHTAFIDIPDDAESRTKFWADMVGRGLVQDEIEKAERSIIEKDKLPF
jgi:hypothetical protein